MYDHGTHKDLKKELKRDKYDEKDKWHGDRRKSDDKRIIFPDDRSRTHHDEKYPDDRSRSYHDEKYKVNGSKEKFDEIERGRRPHTDKYRVDLSSRDHASDRSDSKYTKDSDTFVANHIKNKIRDNDYEDILSTKEQSLKQIDSQGRKRSPDANIEFADIEPRSKKEARSSDDVVPLENYKSESNDDRGRPESIHSHRVEPTPSYDHRKNSPVSIGHAVNDKYSLKQEEAVQISSSKDRYHSSSASSGDHVSVSGIGEDFAHSIDIVADNDPNSMQYEHASVIRSIDRSPSDRQNPDRKGTRRSLDVDEIGKRNSKDTREHPIKEERGRDFSQGQFPNAEAGRGNILSHNWADHLARGSPSHLPLPPPVRHGMDSPTQKSGEDDGRGQAGDYKMDHYKRGGDINMGRGHGSTWNGIPSWSPPIANGFMPFQHGPPRGFLSVPQQFPPPMFGVRPFMDFSHGGVPLHMHEFSDRFLGGWQNPADDSGRPPHMPNWGRNNGVFGNDPHMYGKSELEQNGHLIGDHGWGMSGSKDQSGITNIVKESDCSSHPPVDEIQTGQNLPINGQNQVGNNEIKPYVCSGQKTPLNPIQNTKNEESLVQPLEPKDDGSDFCSMHLSKLDISHDLTCSSLYNECISIVKSEEHEVGDKVNKCARDQDANGGIKSVARSLNASRKLSFSAKTDAVFKKALSLYQKSLGKSGVKKMAPVVPEEAQDSPKTLNAVDSQQTEDVGPLDTTELTAMDSPKLSDDKVELSESKAQNTADAGENEGDLVVEANPLGVDMEVDSSTISSSGSLNAFPAGNKGCESLLPECLSRIPNSPQSTH